LSNKSLPWQLFAAASVLFVESLVLFGGAAYFAYGAITGQARLLATLIALIAFTLFAGLWFVSLGVGLIQGKRSSRPASDVCPNGANLNRLRIDLGGWS